MQGKQNHKRAKIDINRLFKDISSVQKKNRPDIANAMLHKTRAISLNYIRYKETSIIARTYTEQFGLQAFVVNGVRTAKTRTPVSLFQPLQLVDLVQYHDEKKDLHRLSEIKTAFALQTIPVHHVKTALAMFVAELISKLVKEGQSNQALFDLVWDWTIALDKQETGFESNHIRLAWQILGPLGIEPDDWRLLFTQTLTPQDLRIAEAEPFFEWLKGGDFLPKIPNGLKQLCFDLILFYTQTHMEGMGTIRSLQVLRTVFH